MELRDGERWTEEAACVGHDPEIFFAVHGHDSAAAKICEECPVKAECLEFSIVNRVEYGVWGGVNEGDRMEIIRRRRIRRARY